MREVDKEEIAQWIQGMRLLAQEYERINKRITKAWEKGLDDYRKVWAEGELPALLETLRKMPIPKEPECKWVNYKKNFEEAIDAQIKGLTVAAEYAGMGVSGSNWGHKMESWMLVSKLFMDNMFTDFRALHEEGQLLRKKYRI